MRISGMEVEALLQQMQVPAQFDPVAVAAPQAVHPSQELFNISDNNVKFKDKKGEKAKEDEEEEERIRYLGYFLAKAINFHKPVNMSLDFGGKLKDKDIIVFLRSFKLGSKDKFLWHQSFSFQVKVDSNGVSSFVLSPLINNFTDINLIYGICVFIIKVKEKPVPKQATVYTEAEEENLKLQESKSKVPNLNIRKRIDTTA